ncbi:MFS transporter [Marivita geojedonensis]|uniref:MFS transporter n=1 Tax=Marivita geojedonensis TaxID=1123756 RepID=A0A1X4NR66_9RHOB|nr:MFS transporter [Marivita geojedonensis]OSQ53381.1 MFS transporter [Marivita geojedonensis]PRY81643.1 sugar phosphate permease [Marivita geojedonensis]
MDAPSALDSRYSWTRLLVTLLIAVMGNVGMWAIIVVMPEVQEEFGAGRADVSLAYTLTMIGFALGNFYVGRAVDRFGITTALIACALTLTASYALAALSPSLLILTALQFVIGFATACSFGPLIADISQWFLKRRGIAVAIAASGNYLSGAIWPLLLGYLADGASWRWSYSALAALTLIIIPPLAMMLRTRVPAEALATADTQSASRTRATGFTPRQLQWMLGIAGIGCCVAMSMPQVHIVALCVDYGFGAAVGAEMLSLMLLGGVVSRLISGTLADRIGGVPTLLIGSTLQAIALFLYLPAGGLVSLYLVSLVFGLSQGGIVPSYAVIVREYMPSREAGARVGFVMMMTIMGMALGGWLSGWIYDVTGSYQWAFVNGIVWNGMNIAIMILIFMRGQRNGAIRTAPA